MNGRRRNAGRPQTRTLPSAEGEAATPSEGAAGRPVTSGGPWTLGAVLFCFTLPLTVPVLGSLPPLRTTAEEGPEGLSELARLAEGFGARVQRIEYGLHELESAPDGALLVVSALEHPIFAPSITEQDNEDLRTFMERGGTVLFASGTPDLFTVGLDLGLSDEPEFDPITEDVRRAQVVGPHPLALAESIVFSQDLAFRDPRGAGGWPLYAVGHQPIVIERTMGTGAAILLADPAILSNAALGHPGNLRWLAGIMQRAAEGAGVVIFDEVHAGGGREPGVLPTLSGLGILGQFFGAAIWLLLFGLATARGLGADLGPGPGEGRRPALDHARALAGLHARAGHLRHATAVLARRLRIEWGRAAARGRAPPPGSPEVAAFEQLAADLPSLLSEQTAPRVVIEETARRVQQLRADLARSVSERRPSSSPPDTR